MLFFVNVFKAVIFVMNIIYRIKQGLCLGNVKKDHIPLASFHCRITAPNFIEICKAVTLITYVRRKNKI